MIETHRLVFRKYGRDDLDFLMTMTSDPEVLKYIGDGSICNEFATREKLERFISRYNHGEGIGLMVAMRKEDEMPIGHAGLVTQVIEGKEETEIGYWISKNYWGQGYATESAIGWRDFSKLSKKLGISTNIVFTLRDILPIRSSNDEEILF